MKIGVNGASGKLGSMIVQSLIGQSSQHQIVGITRTPPESNSNVEYRFGDYDKESSLLEAYTGLDKLFLIPSMDGRPGARSIQNVAAIKAAIAAGVGHIVFLSGCGTRETEEPHLNASYWVAEQYLMQNAPKWTILRMNSYSEMFLAQVQQSKQTGILPCLSNARIAFVSRNDIAQAAASILLNTGHAGYIYNATGPQAFSAEERAQLITEITGVDVTCKQFTKQQLLDLMLSAGVPEPLAYLGVALQEEFDTGGLDIVTGDIEKLTGKAPISLQEVIRQSIAGQ